MLLGETWTVLEKRCTSRVTSKELGNLYRLLDSSRALYEFDMGRRPRNRELKFTAVQMVMVLFYIEIRRMTIEAFLARAHGYNGQRVLANLGMPKDGDGRHLCPSLGWISDFRNHCYPEFRVGFEMEIQELVIGDGNGRVYTVDSTPAEANRYSVWADFTKHYQVKMAKAHIIMCGGVPARYRVTNGDRHDAPPFVRMMEDLPNRRFEGSLFLADGTYDGWECYISVYLRTGCVLSSNLRSNAKFHDEATWPKVLEAYNRMHRLDGFIPSSRATPDFIIRFIARNGKEELAGWFLRNLDYMRGNRIHTEHARKRHVCESVHRAMKRWVNLDVKGMCRRHAGRRLMLRLDFCTILCLMFKPYMD